MPARMTRARRTARTMVAVVAPPSSSSSIWWSTSMSLLMFIPSRLLKDYKHFIKFRMFKKIWFHLARLAASSLVRNRPPSSSSVKAVRKRRDEDPALAYNEESLQYFKKVWNIWQVVNWPFVTVLIKICKSRTEPLECKLVMVSITRVGSWGCGTRRCCLCRWGRWWRNPSQLRTPSPSPWSVPPPVPKKCSFQKQFIAIGNVGKIKCTCCHLVLPWQWCSLHLLPCDSHKHWNNKLILTKF